MQNKCFACSNYFHLNLEKDAFLQFELEERRRRFIDKNKLFGRVMSTSLDRGKSGGEDGEKDCEIFLHLLLMHVRSIERAVIFNALLSANALISARVC